MKQQIQVVEEFQLPNTDIILEVGDEILVERNVKKMFIVLGEHLNGDILMVPSIKFPGVFTLKEAKNIAALNNSPSYSRYDPFVSWRIMSIKDAEKAMVGIARDAVLKIIARENSTDSRRLIMRKMKSFNEANVTTAADLATEFESIFKSYFRDSFISSVVKTSLGKSIFVHFSLGNGQKEYRNGIVHNDPMHTQFHIWLNKAVDDSFTIIGPMEMERSLGSGIKIIGSQYLELKVPFRKTTGDANRLLKAFDIHISRLVQTVKENLQVIQQDNPQMDVASKI